MPENNQTNPLEGPNTVLLINVRNKLRTRRKKMKQFFLSTSFHGLRYIYAASTTCGKIFWVTIFACGFCLVSLQIYQLFSYFSQNPTVTDVDVLQPRNGLALPNITVCILTKIHRKKLLKNYPDIRRIVVEFGVNSFLTPYSTSLLNPNHFNFKQEQLENEFQQILNGTSLDKFFESISFDCEDVFLKCWFQNGQVYNCCNSNNTVPVFKRFLAQNGPCFYFEHDQEFTQKMPGPVGGFGFSYKSPSVGEYYPLIYGSYQVGGVHLFTSPADALLEKNPIVLPIGSHSHVSLKPTLSRQRPPALSFATVTCRDQPLYFFDSYSYQKCQLECMLNTLQNLCNCTVFFPYSKQTVEDTCTPLEYFYCFVNHSNAFSNLLTECRMANCTEPCDYWSYSHSSTNAQISFEKEIEAELKTYWKLPNDTLNSKLVFADIYFEEILYTRVTRVCAFTFEAFVSSIGGALGLWTGASIITLIHAIYFCFSFCCAKNPQEFLEDSQVSLWAPNPAKADVETKLAAMLEKRELKIRKRNRKGRAQKLSHSLKLTHHSQPCRPSTSTSMEITTRNEYGNNVERMV